MRRFVFRAQVALDLRRRQEDEAQRALALAEGRLGAAQSALGAARDALATTMRRAGDADGQADVALQVWYRNWIVRQKQDIARATQAVAACQADVDQAKARVMVARRKRKSLERFRERALTAFERAQDLDERKALDALGTLRFALAKQGGTQ